MRTRLPCRALICLTLHCPALPCPALSCPALLCPVSSLVHPNLHALLHLPIFIYCTTVEDLKNSESGVGVSTHVFIHRGSLSEFGKGG